MLNPQSLLFPLRYFQNISTCWCCGTGRHTLPAHRACSPPSRVRYSPRAAPAIAFPRLLNIRPCKGRFSRANDIITQSIASNDKQHLFILHHTFRSMQIYPVRSTKRSFCYMNRLTNLFVNILFINKITVL